MNLHGVEWQRGLAFLKRWSGVRITPGTPENKPLQKKWVRKKSVSDHFRTTAAEKPIPVRTSLAGVGWHLRISLAGVGLHRGSTPAGVLASMDRHLLDAFIDSFTDTLADKVAQRLAGPLRPPVKAIERPLERPAPVALVPAATDARAPTPPSDADLLDTVQAAELLGVSPGTLENWRAEGKGPKFRRVGRLIRYRRGDLTE